MSTDFRAASRNGTASEDQIRPFSTFAEAETAASFSLPNLACLPIGYESHDEVALQKAGDDSVITAIYVLSSDYLNICIENPNSSQNL